MAYAALGGLKQFFKCNAEAIDISNATFTLAKLTTAVLIGCSILTTSKQFFGDPIHCHKDQDVPNMQVFESYCFMEETYTLAVKNCSSEDDHHLYDCSIGAGFGRSDQQHVFHSYYQWVPLVLVLQAAFCYLPWYFWKKTESGKVRKLLAGLSSDPLTETSVDHQVASLGDFLLSNQGWFNTAALKLLLCQAASFLSSLSQLYIMDLFLGRRFFNLGSNVFNYAILRAALNEVFPRVVMCSMDAFGLTASVSKISGLCTLPVNIVNEKIYLILWFVFLAHTFVALLQLIRQAALLFISLRIFLTPSLTSSLTSPRQVRQLLLRSSYGDTVLLQLIAANCDSAQFAALVQLMVRGKRLDDSYVSQQLALGKKNDIFQTSFQTREDGLESDLYSKQQTSDLLTVTPHK